MTYVFYLPNLFTGCHSTKNNYKGIGKKHKKAISETRTLPLHHKLPASNWQVTVVSKPNFDQVVVYEPAATKVPMQLERTLRTGSRRKMKFFLNGCMNTKDQP